MVPDNVHHREQAKVGLKGGDDRRQRVVLGVPIGDPRHETRVHRQLVSQRVGRVRDPKRLSRAGKGVKPTTNKSDASALSYLPPAKGAVLDARTNNTSTQTANKRNPWGDKRWSEAPTSPPTQTPAFLATHPLPPHLDRRKVDHVVVLGGDRRKRRLPPIDRAHALGYHRRQHQRINRWQHPAQHKRRDGRRTTAASTATSTNGLSIGVSRSSAKARKKKKKDTPVNEPPVDGEHRVNQKGGAVLVDLGKRAVVGSVVK